MGEFMLRLISQIFSVASPAMRAELAKFCSDYKESAKKTPNPWDDILAEMLCWIVGVK